MTRISFIWIFMAALAARLLYLGVVFDGPESLMHKDSALYLHLADWLLMDGAERAAADVDYSRMMFERAPGYIYFVAGLSWLFEGEHHLAVVAVQAILDAATCVLTGHLAGLIHRRLALPAGLIAAFNVNMIVNSALVLSDSFFLLPFVAGTIAVLRYLMVPTAGSAITASLFFAIALLIRPLLLFFPPILIVILAIGAWNSGIGARKTILHLLTVPLMFAVFVGPVFVKNHDAFGHVAYTSQSGAHTLFWVYPQATELALGVPREQSLVEMRSRWLDYRDRAAAPADRNNPFAQSAELRDVGAAAIRELGIMNLAKAWVYGTIINLSAPAIIISPAIRNLKRPSFYETVGANPADKIWNYLADNATFSMVILPAAMLTVLARLITCAGLLQLLPNRFLAQRGLPGPTLSVFPAATLLLISFYVFAVTGPITGVKYRLPIEPASDISLAAALIWLADIARMRFRGARRVS